MGFQQYITITHLECELVLVSVSSIHSVVQNHTKIEANRWCIRINLCVLRVPSFARSSWIQILCWFFLHEVLGEPALPSIDLFSFEEPHHGMMPTLDCKHCWQRVWYHLPNVSGQYAVQLHHYIQIQEKS